MDDFLHKLRNSRNKPNYDRGRRPADAFPYRGAERKKTRNRKNTPSVSMSAEYLPAIKKALEALVENQRHLIDAANARLDVEQRKTGLLENIAQRLDELLGKRPVREIAGQVETDPPPGDPSDRKDVGPLAGCAVKADREKVIEIIQGLREEGRSYESIAQHLETENIPTLSGRGKWRSQSIHRIYKQLA